MPVKVARPKARLPLLGRLLRVYLRSEWRGCTRAASMLASRIEALHQLPIRVGSDPPFFVDLRTDGALDWLRGTPYETAPTEAREQALMDRLVRQGHVVYDIGANVGQHTVHLAQLVGEEGRVLAFEPNPSLIPNLRRTIEPLHNARLFDVALSDADGEACFFVPQGDHTMASLTDWTAAPELRAWHDRYRLGKSHRYSVVETRLDRLVEALGLPPPAFVKCDVEGAELKVFRGALNVLSRAEAPVVMFELNAAASKAFGQEPDATLRFLRDVPLARYGIFDLDGCELTAPPDLQGASKVDLVAVPAKMRSLFAPTVGA